MAEKDAVGSERTLAGNATSLARCMTSFSLLSEQIPPVAHSPSKSNVPGLPSLSTHGLGNEDEALDETRTAVRREFSQSSDHPVRSLAPDKEKEAKVRRQVLLAVCPLLRRSFPLAPPATAHRLSDHQSDPPSRAEKTPFSGCSPPTARSGHDRRRKPSLPACSRPGQGGTCHSIS